MKAMPHKPNVSVWKALLSTCRIHGNAGLGEPVANQIVELVDENAQGYVLLSSIYVAAAAAAGNRHLCEKVEQRRKERGMKRQLDYTRIEVKQQMWYH